MRLGTFILLVVLVFFREEFQSPNHNIKLNALVNVLGDDAPWFEAVDTIPGTVKKTTFSFHPYTTIPSLK